MNALESPALPSFDNPPVVETVLSAQFEPLTAIHAVHWGLFWHQVRDRFPKTEEKAAVPQAIESFESLQLRIPRLRFEASDSVPPSRLMFINDAGTEMIQLQTDRFIRNWRKVSDRDKYPRYEQLKPLFENDFAAFKAFLQAESLGAVNVTQCEVTYVNHIVAGDGWTNWTEAAEVFSFLSKSDIPPEDCAFVARFPLADTSGKLIGRLYLDVQPALSPTDGKQMYVMNLTARGLLGSGLEFFDLGRKSIVEAFARLTTPRMHQVWRRTQ